jgi:SAM-dependent methyltransferase
MRRTVCSACGDKELNQFLDLGNSPIADAYTDTPDRDVPRYPLELAVCGNCYLVQLMEVLDTQTLFGTGYSFYSSASPPLSNYHAAYAESLFKPYDALLRKGILEIGCNDGDFLRHFTNYPSLGVDPAMGPRSMARQRGLEVRSRAFSLDLAMEMDKVGVVVANHVLAHVEDVFDVLAGISQVLADDGVAIIEVQYLPDLLLNNAFDLVYHEHRNFFSITSLASAARLHGLQVDNVQFTQRQGGSIRVTLSHGTCTHLDGYEEEWLQDPSTYAGFQGRAERVVSRIWDLITGPLLATPIVGYGAPAKATTLLNFCGLSSNEIEFVVDTTPAKQGRYIPGTGLPILAADEPHLVDTYLLLAHNYMAEILRKEKEFTAAGGRWIIPLPAPVIL